MKVPISWFKDYTDINFDNENTKDLGEDITLTGTKVEAIEYLGRDITNVVVGKITEIEKHPDAEKLVVTQIDVGTEKIQIVTGAKNVNVGDYVPVALHGSTLANDVKIKKGKLRGVDSNGMLCSIEELGYTKADYPEAPEDGIYIFQEEHELGKNVVDILKMADDVIEFELTNNRVDCYCVTGLARELAATKNAKFSPYLNIMEKEMEYKGSADGKTASDYVEVEINTDNCKRYMGAIVKNVKIEPSPLWLRQRLIASGLRPINNIVDITNYVMLEYGQPMHAFDISTVKDSKIIVRNAEKGEKFTTLDGEDRVLDEEMVVIGDTEKALAIGGIMGGENSKVTDNSEAILFESANFTGVNIRLSSKKLGLRTDASGKYEKGLDPNVSAISMKRALELVEELNCGEVVKGYVDVYKNPIENHTVNFKLSEVTRLLGIDVTFEMAKDYLSRIDIKVENKGEEIVANVPTSRQDVKEMADIAEEIGRLYGFNNLPVTLATGTPTAGKRTTKQVVEEIIKNQMISLGLSECMTYSFESPKVFNKLNIPETSDLRKVVEIVNPLGEDFSIMRTTTLNGHLTSISTNYNRRNEKAWLFEISNVYIPNELPVVTQPTEKMKLTFSMYGGVDFFHVKGITETLFDRLGIKAVYDAEKELPFMHPGRCAKISLEPPKGNPKDNLQGKQLGFIGEIHPEVSENYSIGTKVYYGELDIELLVENAELFSKYKPLPKFPAIRRDIALLARDEIPSRDIEKIIIANGGKLLQNVEVFDVYKDSKIGKENKSIAYALSFRANDRTLVEDDVTKPMEKILAKLKEELDITLRG